MRLKPLTPTFIRSDNRGIFIEAINGTRFANVSFGMMRRGAVMGNHYHKKTKVFFYIINGKAIVDTIDPRTGKMKTVVLKENQGILFPPYCSHAIRFSRKTTFVMGKTIKYDKENSDTFMHPVPKGKNFNGIA